MSKSDKKSPTANSLTKEILAGKDADGDTSGESNGHKNGNGHKKNGKNGKAKFDAAARERLRAQICADYFDVRMFGAVLGGEGGSGADNVRGPIQAEISNSINAPEIEEAAITRCAVASTKLAEQQNANRTMGVKHFVHYALFCTRWEVDAYPAQKSGLTYGDLLKFFESLIHIFDLDGSSARPEMNVCKLVIARHDSPLGSYPRRNLREHVINIRQRVTHPRAYSDFDVVINTAPPVPTIQLFEIDPVVFCNGSATMAGILGSTLTTPIPENAKIENKYTAWLIWEAVKSNPNGDPDNANKPRLDSVTGQCLVTDVCLKRKVRNWLVQALNHEIYVADGAVLSQQRDRSAEKIGVNAPEDTSGGVDGDSEDGEDGTDEGAEVDA